MADPKISKHVDQLATAVDQIQTALGPILSQPLTDTLPKLTPIQRCELEALVAYAINTLYWVYLKVNGVPPKEHPVMDELQRVQRYIEKINRAKKSNNKQESRAMRVDANAASRIIQNATSKK
ncbi:hypothetical protein H4S08_004288 [Coemansia sp. RSA 1365]|nr:hypothetical protein H4S08_004288 [Coemansia sp. RSA 1365]